MNNPGLLLPFIVLIGAMFLMSRSAKNKQRQAQQMRAQMEPGTGVRTIGGMYAIVKEVGDETVLLELTDGVHAHFAKNAIGAVLEDSDYNRIVHGIEPEHGEDGAHAAGVADAGGAPADAQAHEDRINLSKSGDDGDRDQPEDGPKTDGTGTK